MHIDDHEPDMRRRTNHSYHTPSLFDDCMAMWAASITAPVATNLRILAQEGKLSERDAHIITTLPVSFDAGVEMFLSNKELAVEEFRDDPGVPFHVSVLQDLPRYCNVGSQEMVVFDDLNRNSEAVYGIFVNR